MLFTEEFNKETGHVLVGMDTLPPDLKDYVKEDNKCFEKELEEWDVQIAQKAQQEKALTSQMPRVPIPSSTEGQYREQVFFFLSVPIMQPTIS